MLLRTSTAAAVLICLLTAFLYTRASDEQIPQGATTVLTIWDSNSELTLRESRATIVAAARSQAVSFIKRGSPSVGVGERVFTLVNRGASSPAVGAYRDFSRSLRTHVRSGPLPLNHLNGMYISSNSPDAVDRVAADLQEHGLSVSTLRTSPLRMLSWAAVTTPTLPLMLAGGILVVLGAAFWTLSVRRRDAIQQVNGRATARSVLGHAGHGIVLCVGLGVVGLVCSVPALIWYNGLAQWTRFAGNAAVGYAVIALLLVATITMTSLIGVRTRPAAAINGCAPSKTALAGVVGLHTIALALLMSIMLSTLVVGATALRSTTERADWSRTADWLAMSLTSNLDRTDRTEAPLAAVIRGQDAEGLVLITIHEPSASENGGPWNGNSLIVNHRYLREQCVRLADDTCVARERLDPSKLTLLVPSAVHDLRGVRQEWGDWARSQRSNFSDDRTVVAESGILIDVLRTAPGQHVFNYGAAGGDETSSQVDPIIAVLPASPDFLSDNWLAASVTSAQVLFEDRRSLLAALDDAGLRTQVGHVDSARAIAANELLLKEQAVRDTIETGVLGAFATVLAAVLLASAQAERRRRIDFTHWTHGGGRRWGFIVALAIANGVAVIGFTASAPFVPWVVPTDPRSMVVAGAVACADLALVAVALAWHRRRVRLDTVRRS
ncbi:hypothetical protein [Curtobacterium sp. RRHDQ10]|uniref:hypothetical protein n=1 Tax=Curtobacterium phyllosphaerae TaxID=3413379 RepID=UPI003BF1C187